MRYLVDAKTAPLLQCSNSGVQDRTLLVNPRSFVPVRVGSSTVSGKHGVSWCFLRHADGSPAQWPIPTLLSRDLQGQLETPDGVQNADIEA